MEEKLNVVVRSYGRCDKVSNCTLSFLDRNGLINDTVLLVANESEYGLYKTNLEKTFPQVPIIITSIGASHSYNKYFSSLPDGVKLFCMDDDIIDMYEHLDKSNINKRTSITNLKRYIEYGFRCVDELKVGAFSFDYSNIFFKQSKGFGTLGFSTLTGGFWGARNSKHLISQFNQDDDSVRLANLLNVFGKVFCFNQVTVKMILSNKNTVGGMNTSGDRLNTLQNSLNILDNPEYEKYFEIQKKSNVNQLEGFTTLKLKKANVLKKTIPNYFKTKVENYFDESIFPK
jgi:hypothetical protein